MQKGEAPGCIFLEVVGPGSQSTSFVSVCLLVLPPSMKALLSGSMRWQVHIQQETGLNFSSSRSSHRSAGPDSLCFVFGPHAPLNLPRWLGNMNAMPGWDQPHNPLPVRSPMEVGGPITKERRMDAGRLTQQMSTPRQRQGTMTVRIWTP